MSVLILGGNGAPTSMDAASTVSLMSCAGVALTFTLSRWRNPMVAPVVPAGAFQFDEMLLNADSNSTHSLLCC